MVRDAVEQVRKRRVQVFTNMVGLRFPEAVYLGNVAELARVGFGLVLLDEASVCVASRYWQQVPRDVLAAFAQSRKNGLDLWFTSQHINRVDTVLREISNEEVNCRRLGPAFVQVTGDPSAKMTIRRRVRRYSRSVMALYDTLERIAIDGSGGAAGLLAEYPAPQYASRKRATAGPVYGAGCFERPVRVWYDHRGRLTLEAEEAKAWLVAGGYLPEWRLREPGWVGLVARELHRRAWLHVFGLEADDCPVRVTYAEPWAAGYSPWEVTERVAHEKEEEAAELLAVQAAARVREGRKQARAEVAFSPREAAKRGVEVWYK